MYTIVSCDRRTARGREREREREEMRNGKKTCEMEKEVEVAASYNDDYARVIKITTLPR